jgi:dipeptidyl aminopeptidase/acylaminoacyl peptidase
MDSPVSRGISHIPFTFPASDGAIIHCDLRFPTETEVPLPGIVYVHGFKGFKDWGWGPYLTSELAGRGFYVISFNFSYNGVEGDGTEFTRLDLFASNTFSREVRELHEVIDAIAAGRTPQPELVDSSHIGLLGHSRGGGIALLEASRDDRIRAVTTWGAVSDFNRYTDRQKQLWRQQGYFESKNMRTGQMMRLDVTLLDDLVANAEALDIGRAVATLGKPLLIVHGEQDLSVRIEEGERLRSLADRSLTEYQTIPRTAHTFGVVHPFEGTTPELEFAIERTAEFFRRWLGDVKDAALPAVASGKNSPQPPL